MGKAKEFLSAHGAKLGTGVNAAFIGMDFFSSLKEGNSVSKSALTAGINFVKADLMTGIIGFPQQMALMAGQLAIAGIKAGIQAGQENAKTINKITKGNGYGRIGTGSFQDNNYAATMRQRAMQEMNAYNQMNRNALGSEARRRSTYVNY